MSFHNVINKTLKKYQDLSREDLFNIIIFLSKRIKNNNDIHLNINQEIDFNIKKMNLIIEKFLKNDIPIEYLTKTFYFCNLKYFICKKTFIPRVETENLVFEILKYNNKESSKQVLDLCSGSGCISNTLQYEYPNWNVLGIEKKLIPIIVSNINKRKYKLNTKFHKADIFNWILKNTNKYDLIVCNPPYISFDYKLPKNVLKEPKTALFAKNEGLAYYEFIIKELNSFLKEDGLLIFEFGFDQKDKLIKILNENGIKNFIFKKDQFGIYRNLYIWGDLNENFKKESN